MQPFSQNRYNSKHYYTKLPCIIYNYTTYVLDLRRYQIYRIIKIIAVSSSNKLQKTIANNNQKYYNFQYSIRISYQQYHYSIVFSCCQEVFGKNFIFFILNFLSLILLTELWYIYCCIFINYYNSGLTPLCYF